MKQLTIKVCLSLCLLWHMQQVSAQGVNSEETDAGLTIGSGSTTASVAETIYLGPGAYQVDGTWEIYSKRVWISPGAIFTGTGTIKFFNPSAAGGVASPTLIDGNNSLNAINVNIELYNAANMILTDIIKPSDAAAAGWDDNMGNAGMLIGGNFNFGVANGDVILGNYDLRTASGSTLSGYQADRFVVTNGNGHLVHNSYTGNFVFPVGIAEGDYTPAAVNNNASNSIHVLVQDYATSPSSESSTAGIDRSWQIFGDNAGTITLALTNDAGTEGVAYARNNAFITQQIAAGVWDVVAGRMPTAPDYTHSRSNLIIPAAGTATSYFSKSSDSVISLSGNAQLDLTVGLQGDMQVNGTMRNDLQNYFGGNTGLLPTIDPYGGGAICADINNPSGVAGTVVDWVKVEIRDAGDPSLVLQMRSLLLRADGHIVDVDGTVPVFTGSGAAARAAVLHRNHLAILSNDIPAGVFKGIKAYDFTTAITQAANPFGDPAQMVLKHDKWCLWAGDVNQDRFIDGSDKGLVNFNIAQNIDETYNPFDINLDAFIDGSDKGILNVNLIAAPNSVLINY